MKEVEKDRISKSHTKTCRILCRAWLDKHTKDASLITCILYTQRGSLFNSDPSLSSLDELKDNCAVKDKFFIRTVPALQLKPLKRKSLEKDIYDEGFGVPHNSVDTGETWEL